MGQLALQINTVVEIDRGANGDIPASLVSAAYRASRAAPILLVLRAVMPNEVDQLLDPVVERNGRHHRGVVYASLTDDSLVLDAAGAASRVFASSADFRAKLTSRGIAFEDVAAAEAAFGRTSVDE